MDESEYIGTQIFATDEHCLATKIEDNYKWVPIYFLRNKLLSVTRFIKVVLCYFVNLLIMFVLKKDQNGCLSSLKSRVRIPEEDTLGKSLMLKVVY